ncbi:MAG: hypothetical protein AAGA65_20255 [Actinomycetota bacterium]
MYDAPKIWEEMPADVRAAIDILLDDGFRIAEAASGGMASGLIRLSGDIEAIVSRDRGQWMFDFHLAGKNLDLDAVIAARTQRSDWTPAAADKRRPTQVPDVEWRVEVAAGLNWLRSNPDAVAQVEEAKRQRSKILWS